MAHALSSAARQAIEKGSNSEGKVLWLLTDACSMRLNPASINEPFKPYMIIEGNRSALPQDFQEVDIDLFSEVAEEIDDIWLRARLADLVWLLKRPRNPKFALLAIDAYRTLPLDTDSWIRGGQECWSRAISLTIILGEGTGDRLNEMEAKLLDSIENATQGNGFLALWLAELIAQHRLGHAKQLVIAEKLADLARRFDETGDVHRTRSYFEASANWFKKAGDSAKSTEMTVCVAETWVKEAAGRMSLSQPSHMVAAVFLERAIQKYRSIPRGERAVHKVDERIAELYAQKNTYGEESINEMRHISSPSIDITKMIESAVSAVRGKSVADAMAAFANTYRGARVNQLRELSEKMLRESPLSSLFPTAHMSSDGRVIARQPGLYSSDPAAKGNEDAVWAEMVKYYGVELGIVVQGYIWPALQALRLDHRIQEAEFVAIASHSPIVPQDRERLFGKALFAGYDGDFVSALHLLVPQIEHMVRWHLKCLEVKTTTLDSKGIETENGLSALMDLPESTKVFGEDLAFEVKALFCDPFGPNLRNELAHGLLSYDACESVSAIYAWWLSLKIVFNTFRNSADRPVEGQNKKI